MAHTPEHGDGDGARPGHTSPGRAPRWVKVFGIVVAVLVLALVVLLLLGGHGPGRHIPSGGSDGHMPPSTIAADHSSTGNQMSFVGSRG